MKEYKSVIFDLDGTLMDTSVGIYKSIDFTLERFGLRFKEIEDRVSFIGPPIETSFKKYFSIKDDKLVEQMVDCFRNIYKDKYLCEANPYQDIFKLLSFLQEKNIKTGVATYKRYDYAEILLEAFNFTSLFESIKGSDFESTYTKIDILENCINNLGVTAEDVLFVGDTLSDLEAAKALNVDFLGVTYGFGLKDNIEYVNENSILIARNVNEIFEIFKNY